MGTVAKEFSRRVSWVHEQRAVKQGRMFSQANLDLLQGVHDGMKSHLDSLNEVLTAHKPAKSLPADTAADTAEALAAYIRFQTTRAVINGVPAS
jgi:hypothetical protein